jgi:membrane-bound lytic murein transglycosylase MltF
VQIRERLATGAAIAALLAASPAGAQPAPTGLPDDVVAARWTGDFDGMLKRRRIRVLTPYSRTHYFVDQGVQRGVVHDAMQKLEEEINAKYATGKLKVHVVIVPTSREDLIPALLDGRGDVVAAGITITPEREQLVDFTNPSQVEVSEIVVTGPGSPPIASVEDLAGRRVFVRPSSSYHASLVALNERFAREGRPAVEIEPAPEQLEDEDLLEMVSAGLVPIVVVDDYLAEFWKQVLPDLALHPGAAVRTGGRIAPAIRKGSPKLRAELDAALAKYGLRTGFGNINFRRYLKSTKYVKSATAEADRERFQRTVELFRRYGDQYRLDWLLMAAQGYQESRLDQSVRSPVGAVGVMQVMPRTGKELGVGDIRQLEPNIHAGVKYIRFMIDRYFENEPMTELDKGLFAFAAYNAGPARVAQLRDEATRRGLDRNRWFNHVERVAADQVGRETVGYVANIYKYYVAYTLAVREMDEKRRARDAVAPVSP